MTIYIFVNFTQNKEKPYPNWNYGSLGKSIQKKKKKKKKKRQEKKK
jgi:hypothetical protein